jgi:hypothetical protein
MKVSVKKSNNKFYFSNITGKYVSPRPSVLSHDFFIYDSPANDLSRSGRFAKGVAKYLGLELPGRTGKRIGWLPAGTRVLMLERTGLWWRRFCLPMGDNRYWLKAM